jgi:hypothetical protein
VFGSLVFNDKLQQERLPKPAYRALRATITRGEPADLMWGAATGIPSGTDVRAHLLSELQQAGLVADPVTDEQRQHGGHEQPQPRAECGHDREPTCDGAAAAHLFDRDDRAAGKIRQLAEREGVQAVVAVDRLHEVHAHAVEVDLVRLLAAERRDRRDGHPGRVARHQDHRQALVTGQVGVGTRRDRTLETCP